MSRKIITVIAALLVSVFVMSACQSVVSAPAVEVVEPTEPVLTEPLQDRTPVYWFIGLGGGSQPDQIVLEEEFVRKYNASQDEIQLLPIIVDNTYALDNLKAQMEIGNAIDIVGPVGTLAVRLSLARFWIWNR